MVKKGKTEQNRYWVYAYLNVIVIVLALQKKEEKKTY